MGIESEHVYSSVYILQNGKYKPIYLQPDWEMKPHLK